MTRRFTHNRENAAPSLLPVREMPDKQPRLQPPPAAAVSAPVSSGTVQKQDDAQMGALYGLSYQTEGAEKLYYFLLVDPEKEEEFKRALSGDTPFDVKAYATIVASGEGEPSEHVRTYVRQRFGDAKNQPPRPIASPEQKLETFDKLLNQYELLEEMAAALSELEPAAFERGKAMLQTLQSALNATTSSYTEYAESGHGPAAEQNRTISQSMLTNFVTFADFLSEVEAVRGLHDTQDYGLRAKIASLDDMEAFWKSTKARFPRLERYIGTARAS